MIFNTTRRQAQLNRFISLLLLTLAFNLAGCTTILDASHDSAIETNIQERTFGEYIDDQNLETVITVNLRKASAALKNNSHIRVHAFKSVILLTGEVPTQLAKQQASETVTKVTRVRKAHNELIVGANSTIRSRAMDKWHTAKIKSKIKSDHTINDDYVKVIVENDIVYLMGVVSKTEAKKFTEHARTTKGIKKVIRVFEYLD